MRHFVISLILLAAFSLCGHTSARGLSPEGEAALAGCAPLNWSDTSLWYEGRTRLKVVDESLPDVFYLLPTCVQAWNDDAGRKHFNADPSRADHRNAWQLSAMLADSIFAAYANLYLPYYRQATFGALDGPQSIGPMLTATRDAIEAFDYYLRHFNHGRRFILAGYSQGANLVKAVLKHIGDDTYSRLIAAYVIGYGVTAADTVTQAGHRQSHIRLACDSTSCGVTVNFNSVTSTDAISPLLCRGNVGCINPVSWTVTSTPAVLLGAGCHPNGDDPRFPYGTAVVPCNDAGEVTVRVDPQHHVLVVDGVDPLRYTLAPLQMLFPVGNLHLQELFFYGDHLRRNVRLRSGMADTVTDSKRNDKQ